MNSGILAHVRESPHGIWIEHDLRDHLQSVGHIAAAFAKPFHGDDWAEVAGLWHDLGKYSVEFQSYLRTASGFEREEGHLEGRKGRVDHSTAGAIHAVEAFGTKGRVLAYLIAGHHAGLPDWFPALDQSGALQDRLLRKELRERALTAEIPSDILVQREPMSSVCGGREGFSLWVRMLFSCLVDADFLDTEAFMDPERSSNRLNSSSMTGLRDKLNGFLEERFGHSEPTRVNVIRDAVRRQCADKAALAPGIFTLSVPTGGGKTLSSLVFALNHCLLHAKRRIIYTIPYTSIIEQTANIFREIFDDSVIEHHSNLDARFETTKSRLASENWDAALVVTTNVQLFESLFAARTSRTRKLHNLIDSVIVLDEAQLIDPAFLQPILDCLRLLVRHYGVTVLISTATQPALASRSGFDHSFRGLDDVREIIDDPETLYRSLERVHITLPMNFETTTNWEEIANRLQAFDQVLCVVNRRSDCRELFRLMPHGTVHLSALMCGEHRSETIAVIKEKLREGRAVRVVSTQLVEAGVDLDFPVVFRALAGLDSIAQAAGRCNREGKLEQGEVVVFVPPTRPPVGILRKGEQVSKSLLSGASPSSVIERTKFTAYFERLYGSTDLDKESIGKLLTPDSAFETQFRTAAARFKLIDDSAYQSVFVPYKQGQDFIGMLASAWPERWLLRKLQRFTVNIAKHDFNTMFGRGDIRQIWRDSYYALSSPALYDETIGVVLPSESLSPDDLVI